MVVLAIKYKELLVWNLKDLLDIKLISGLNDILVCFSIYLRVSLKVNRFLLYTIVKFDWLCVSFKDSMIRSLHLLFLVFP